MENLDTESSAVPTDVDVDPNFQPYCAPCVTVDVSAVREEVPADYVPPIERIIIPHDVIDIQDSDESVYIVGTKDSKVTCIRGLERNTKLKELTLRACLLIRVEGLENLQNLEKLELYDNVIEKLEQLDHVPHLQILDLSFNSIKDMSPVSVCRHLKELYIAQNKLKEIKGLEEMKELRVLDLGANRLRSMDGIQGLVALESLWLGKNKIESLVHVGHLAKLRQLDVQCNRLTSLGDDLGRCQALHELYLANNAIISTSGLPSHAPLTIIDLSSNKTKQVGELASCMSLEEVWMTGSAIEALDELTLFQPLTKLTCLYLEHSPVAKIDDYRNQVKAMFPALLQLDADLY